MRETPAPMAEAEAMAAGSVPRDGIDGCYLTLLVHSFTSFTNSGCAALP